MGLFQLIGSVTSRRHVNFKKTKLPWRSRWKMYTFSSGEFTISKHNKVWILDILYSPVENWVLEFPQTNSTSKWEPIERCSRQVCTRCVIFHKPACNIFFSPLCIHYMDFCCHRMASTYDHSTLLKQSDGIHESALDYTRVFTFGHVDVSLFTTNPCSFKCRLFCHSYDPNDKLPESTPSSGSDGRESACCPNDVIN